MAKTYNSIPTVSTGDVYTATAHNNIVTNVNNYRVPPMCLLQRTADATVTNNTDISWSTTPVLDTDGMFSSGQPTRVTPTTAGIYLVSASWTITAASALGINYCYIGKNASFSYASSLHPVDGLFSRVSCTTVMQMNGTTDYIVCSVGWASATGTVTLLGTTDNATRARLAVTWLGQVS